MSERDEFQELRKIIETVWKWQAYTIDPKDQYIHVCCYDGAEGNYPVRSITLDREGAAREARELDAKYWQLD